MSVFVELERSTMELLSHLEVATRQLAQECVAQMATAVAEGHPETRFNEWTVLELMRQHLQGAPREAAFAVGRQTVWSLLRSLLWEEFGITVGRHRCGRMTVRGARRGTVGAELRRQLHSQPR